jgi:DNA-binding FrmR family transcriptional regulator
MEENELKTENGLTESLPTGYHRHSDGSIHCHHHDDTDVIPAGHSHSHGHTHTQTKAVVNRLARAIGHLESVKNMVESGRDCTEVLVQLAAVRSALSSTAKVILKDHLEHCISEDSSNTEEQLRALNDAIDKFM